MMKVIIAVFSVFLLSFACSNTTSSGDPDNSNDPDLDEIADETVDETIDETVDETTDEVTDEVTDEEIPDDPNSDAGEPIHGRIILQSYPESDKNSAMISANFYDKPMRLDAFSPFQPSLQKLALKKGDCSIFLADINAACNPQCGSDEFCNADSKCEKFSVSQSAGKITVSDTFTEKSMEYSPDDYFPGYYAVEFSAEGLYSEAMITAVAAGDTIPAFTMSVKAPEFADISLGSDSSVNLYDDKDTEITWTSTGNAGETVMLILNVGWHGAPPEATIICSAPDSAGKITIDKEISTLAPIVGGAGLFPHPSYLVKISKRSEIIDNKTIELWAGFYYNAYPVHE
ncbi:MAG TPA: hypothetical protein PKG52_03175 [bacterium]|nr:hypothetical protein [bacterium]HPS30542.1 hypothetical protein [bacterium]